MSRYDLTRASDTALLAAVRAVIGEFLEPTIRVPLAATTRRGLEACAAVLVDEPAESFLELDALRAECRVKTLAEYDREIGQMMRDALPMGAAVNVYSSGRVISVAMDCNRLSELIEASRAAPEDAP